MSKSSGWEKWAEWNQRNMQGLCDWMGRVTEAAPGRNILDVACGVGIPALSLAKAGAKVTATDVSAEMISAIGRRAAESGVRIDVEEMSADDLRFADATFDAVTCSFGLMFVPDIVKAVSEIRRVSKPGGKFALAVWDEAQRSPFFTTAFGALQQIAPTPPPPPNAPSMFGLGAPGALDKVLRAGGFSDFTIETLPIVYENDSIEEYFEMFSDMAPPIHNAVRTLPVADVERLRQAMADAIAPFTREGRIRLPASAVVACGRR